MINREYSPLVEDEMHRFFKSGPPSYAPENRRYFLMYLERDSDGNPTSNVKFNHHETWYFLNAREFTKLCLEMDPPVPDVHQRIDGDVTEYYKYETPQEQLR